MRQKCFILENYGNPYHNQNPTASIKSYWELGSQVPPLFGVFKMSTFVTVFPQLRKVSIELPPFAVLGHNSEK